MNIPVTVPASVGTLSVTLGGTLFATLDTEVVNQAPATLTVTVTGAMASSAISVEISGNVVATAQASSDGIAQVPVPITASLGGAVGINNLLVRQTVGANDFETAVLTYSVTVAPALLPSPQAADVSPVPVPEAEIPSGRSWVFQDLAPGGLGSYVLPISPASMSSPHYEHEFTSKSTASKSARKFHIFQAATFPKEWTFGGYCPTEEMAEMLLAFRALNRRIYVIDHHGRAWKVAITDLSIIPRLRHVFNGEISDWGSDWEMTVTMLDQKPVLVS